MIFFKRDTGFRGDFNQKSGNLRQGTGNSGYNRDNRYQSGRFGSNNYEQRYVNVRKKKIKI